MTIVAERVFTVRVKVEASHVSALDEATAILRGCLLRAVPERRLILGPGRTEGIRIITHTVEQGVILRGRLLAPR